MSKKTIRISVMISLVYLFCSPGIADLHSANAPDKEDKVLVDFSCFSYEDSVRVDRGTYRWQNDSLVLEIEPNQGGQVLFVPPQGKWDCSDYAHIAVNMANLTDNDAHIRCFVANEGGTDFGDSSIIEGRVSGRQQKDMKAFLYRRGTLRENTEPLARFEGMSGLPGGFMTHWHTIDPTDIRYIRITVAPTPNPQAIAFKNVRAARYLLPRLLAEDPDGFFPFIDTFGQYAHDNWPGKTDSIDDLTRNRKKEEYDLQQHRQPDNFNKYGGWKDGPQLDATGHFRTDKIDDFWWLVDPEGKLFWSFGSNSVNPTGGNTRITGRKEYFADLPENKGHFEQFYRNMDSRDLLFDFLSLNRYRKYGTEWRQHTRMLNHKRMRSWGLNTLGAWTEEQTYLMRKTPYTVMIHSWSGRITARTPDPFDPNLRIHLRNALKDQAQTSGNDPWCIGYFIDNEIEWLMPNKILSEIITADPTLNAKKALVGHLRDKYNGIEKLNEAWGVQFLSFQAILENTQCVDISNTGQEDAVEFYMKLLETYYRICKEEIKRIAPDKLYLGSRLHKHNQYVLAAVAKYCDAVSYNLYRFTLEDFSLSNVDKPIISTEFHFGAIDRGMFSTGLKGASDQQDRVYLLDRYVTTAQKNPNIIGVHWFTFNSQPTTGRGDGENYQIGLVDICDRPYAETIKTLRHIGASMYQRRISASKNNQE